jgi:hypothetical protein
MAASHAALPMMHISMVMSAGRPKFITENIAAGSRVRFTIHMIFDTLSVS